MSKLKSNSVYINLLLIIISPLAFTSCDNSEGLFGHSETKEEAKANGSTVVEYIANKTNFNLIDGTKMQIDTAWTEISFTYHNGKKILDSTDGSHFSIPVNNHNLEKFTFTLSLLDKSNQVFTNAGPGEDGLCQLCPRYLYDTMKVILEQKNPDTAFGWLKPIITDTIIFIKTDRNERKI
jgi:hypothetical protein